MTTIYSSHGQLYDHGLTGAKALTTFMRDNQTPALHDYFDTLTPVQLSAAWKLAKATDKVDEFEKFIADLLKPFGRDKEHLREVWREQFERQVSIVGGLPYQEISQPLKTASHSGTLTFSDKDAELAYWEDVHSRLKKDWLTYSIWRNGSLPREIRMSASNILQTSRYDEEPPLVQFHLKKPIILSDNHFHDHAKTGSKALTDFLMLQRRLAPFPQRFSHDAFPNISQLSLAAQLCQSEADEQALQAFLYPYLSFLVQDERFPKWQLRAQKDDPLTHDNQLASASDLRDYPLYPRSSEDCYSWLQLIKSDAHFSLAIRELVANQLGVPVDNSDFIIN